MIASSLKKHLGVMLFGMLLLPQMALAQQSTLLPNSETEYTEESCAKKIQEAGDLKTLFDTKPENREEYMFCAIKSGQIHLWMIPYFISYFADFFIGIAGLISVLFVLMGGFWYMTGGVTDDKEKGKKTITYALLGLVLTLLAWIIVNVLQVQVTR